MWQILMECMSQRRIALCIPAGGQAVPLVYWYGILASIGIALGAFYASKHMESENEDPDLVWDALLWILIPALLGARLWYVAQAVIGGSTAFSFARPLEILNPRSGGMNIFGGALFGLIAMIIYVRSKKLDGWVLADGALLGLLIGQGIGRFGNFINIELYGPPTNSDWFGLIVPPAYRLSQFTNLPPETRFHPTMLYEAAWLFISFGILYYLFRRYQKYMVHGLMTGGYFVLAGIGRFIMEFWRPDQPGITTNTGVEISFSRIMSMVYVIVGIVIVLDRLGYMRIPFINRPKTLRQRVRYYDEMERLKIRDQLSHERERMRDERRRARRQRTNGPVEENQETQHPEETG